MADMLQRYTVVNGKALPEGGTGLTEISDPLNIDNLTVAISAVVPTMPYDDKSSNAANTKFVYDVLDAELLNKLDDMKTAIDKLKAIAVAE